MSKKLFRISVILAVVAAIMLGVAPHSTRAAAPVTVRLFIGLGAGTNPEQIPPEKALADEWNAAHQDIKLELDIVPNNQARDALLTELAGDNPPDIVGPAGIKGLYQSSDAWADISALMKANKVDTSDMDKATLKLYELNGKQIAIPLGIYPSFLWVNNDLFKNAGVDLPPTKYGDKGVATYADGKPWDMDKLAEIAKKLTIDKNGKDATDKDFDAANIASYGFADYWTDLRGFGSHFNPVDIGVTAAGKPDFSQKAYVDGLTFLNDGIWKDHFIPTSEIFNALKPAPFSSGAIAMWYSHTWYNFDVSNIKFDWSLAVAPGYDGKLTARMNADTFALTAKGKHQKEAFQILNWLTGEKSADVCAIYGCMPARASAQKTWMDTISKTIPQFAADNFGVITGAIPYLDAPNFEGFLPNYNQCYDIMQQAFNDVGQKKLDDPAKTLKDIDAQEAKCFTSKPPAATKAPPATIQVIAPSSGTAAPTMAATK